MGKNVVVRGEAVVFGVVVTGRAVVLVLVDGVVALVLLDGVVTLVLLDGVVALVLLDGVVVFACGVAVVIFDCSVGNIVEFVASGIFVEFVVGVVVVSFKTDVAGFVICVTVVGIVVSGVDAGPGFTMVEMVSLCIESVTGVLASVVCIVVVIASVAFVCGASVVSATLMVELLLSACFVVEFVGPESVGFVGFRVVLFVLGCVTWLSVVTLAPSLFGVVCESVDSVFGVVTFELDGC